MALFALGDLHCVTETTVLLGPLLELSLGLMLGHFVATSEFCDSWAVDWSVAGHSVGML